MRTILAAALFLSVFTLPFATPAQAEAPLACAKYKAPRQTTRLKISGNLDPASQITFPGFIPDTEYGGGTTFEDLSSIAAFSTSVPVFDSLGGSHDVSLYFFHTFQNTFEVRGYVNEEEIYPFTLTPGLPRSVMNPITLNFTNRGRRQNRPPKGFSDVLLFPGWANGAEGGHIDLTFQRITQFATGSAITSIRQNGRGAGCS